MSEGEERVVDCGDSSTPPPASSSETAESDSKTEPDSPKLPVSPALKQKSSFKVEILLKPAGNAPIMKKKKWAVERTKTFSSVAEFIKKYIKIEQTESLFLYVNQSFAPSPDTEIGSIFDCFGSDGQLVLHYCLTEAWG